MKKVLIISGSYPNYGGEATTAYGLLKLLRSNHHNAIAVFVNGDNDSNADPDNIGHAYNLQIKPRTIIHILYNKINGSKKQRSAIDTKKEHAGNPVSRSLYYNSRLLPKIMLLLLRKRFNPDTIISFNPIYFTVLNKIFPSKKIITIAAGCPEMSLLCKQGIDAVSVMRTPAIAKNATQEINNYPYGKMNIVFNSPLTQQLYSSLGIVPDTYSTQYFNITGCENYGTNDFDNRLFDMGFISSNFNRKVKNPTLAKFIFEHFESIPKLAIGRSSETFQNTGNCKTITSLTQSEVISYLTKTKLLLITSYFDSSPGVLSEAILSGCNVLVSKNVGWHEILDERCVVQDNNNTNEWINKAQYLLNNKIDYSVFEKMIADSETNILNIIDSIRP